MQPKRRRHPCDLLQQNTTPELQQLGPKKYRLAPVICAADEQDSKAAAVPLANQWFLVVCLDPFLDGKLYLVQSRDRSSWWWKAIRRLVALRRRIMHLEFRRVSFFF